MHEQILIISGIIFLILLAVSVIKGVVKFVLPVLVILAVLVFLGPRLGWFEEKDVQEKIERFRDEFGEKALDSLRK
ncbi:MAG: hypothetical protein ACQEQ4_05580 [Fibrobacterota bacterium]